jgi:hypothetical protein
MTLRTVYAPDAGPSTQGSPSNTRSVTLQSGSYGAAYLFSGVEVPTNGSIKRPVLISLSHSWKGTDGIPLTMRGMLILGEALPLPGSTCRLIVDLKQASYRFPTDIVVERECVGYCTDGAEGRDGIIGEYRTNIGDLAPMVMAYGAISGGGKGINSVLNTATQTTTVGVTASQVVTESASPLAAAAGGALEGMMTPFQDYIMRAMAPVAPTIVAQNGQPVTVVLTRPIIFDGISPREWGALVDNSSQHRLWP